jgi:hypothetical protein
MAAALDEQLATLDCRAAAAKAMYAAMSSDDRQQPARVVSIGGADRPPAFAFTESDEATPVVVLNPALMDSRLSRAVPQVLAIEISSKTIAAANSISAAPLSSGASTVAD